MGSWKIKPILLPRTSRIACGERPEIFSPFKYTSPPAMVPGGLSRSITALPTVDFPAPDSPTTPTISPRWISKVSDFTAACTP
ncbi:hypothetical protein DN38_3044 [Vibrio cholerae]|nr:hypothetical protein DN38_3044 [Vibrio cholerae]